MCTFVVKIRKSGHKLVQSAAIQVQQMKVYAVNFVGWKLKSLNLSQFDRGKKNARVKYHENSKPFENAISLIVVVEVTDAFPQP